MHYVNEGESDHPQAMAKEIETALRRYRGQVPAALKELIRIAKCAEEVLILSDGC